SWSSAYDRWVAAMVADPDQPNDPEAFYPATHERLASFFFGPDLRYLGPYGLSVMPSIEPSRRIIQFTIEIPYSLLPPTLQLEVSTDFLNWSPLPESAFLGYLPLGNGATAFLLQDPRTITTAEPRFYRVQIQNP
ncbi:MAG: hypothetical protein AB3N63_04955, partial [Puniceicoccaceae bacterium]